MTAIWLERNIDLKDKHILHMRPAQRIVETAGKFKSDIRVVKDHLDVNAKNFFDVIEFAAHMRLTAKDNLFKLKAAGLDAEQALEALAVLCDNRFGLE